MSRINWFNVILNLLGSAVILLTYYLDAHILTLTLACFFWGMTSSRYIPILRAQ